MTGANVSVRIDDEFMKAATEGRPYMQTYPVTVAIQIDSQQPATVVRTQRYLSARIGGNSTEAEIGIALQRRATCLPL